MAARLRTVPEPEPSKPKPPSKAGRPKSLQNAANSSEREMLVALRNKLAKQIESDDVAAHALGRLVREFRQIDKDIRELDRRAKQQSSDDDTDDVDTEWDGSFT